MKEGKSPSGVFQVQQGVVVPPVVLRALLPDVASVVKDAMTVGPSKPVQPSTPEPQHTDDIVKPFRKKNILSPFPCNICKLRFPSRHTLNVHRLTHEYECHHCNIPFGSKALLLKHKCPICKICNKPSGNAEHKNCPKVFSLKCVEKFKIKTNFTTHQKVHVHIEKVYGHCPTCCKQFTNETDLINDVNKTIPCLYCKKYFPNIEELSAHSIEHPPKFSCKICKEIFEDSFTATSHSRSHMAPMRSYSRKPKPVNVQKKQQATSIKKLKNNVVDEDILNEPCSLYNKPEPESVNKLDKNNDERRLFDKIEDIYDQRFDEDSEERLEMTEPKLYCVKDQFEVDEEMIEPNQTGLDIGIPSKQLPTHEGMKVEAGVRENKRETIEKGLEQVVSEETSKLLECVKVEPRDEEMREAIEQVDVVTRKPSKPFDKVEPEFRAKDIKKEPNERGLESSNFEADEEHDVKLEPTEIPEESGALDVKPCLASQSVNS